jgi:hypothetical protein
LWKAHERLAKQLAEGPAPAAPEAGIYDAGRGPAVVGGKSEYPDLEPKKAGLWGRMKGWLARKVPAEESETEEVAPRRRAAEPAAELSKPPAIQTEVQVTAETVALPEPEPKAEPEKTSPSPSTSSSPTEVVAVSVADATVIVAAEPPVTPSKES